MTVIFNVQDQSADNSLYQRAVNSDLPIAGMLGGAVRYCVPAGLVDYAMAADLPDDEFDAPGISVWIEWQREGMEVGFLLHEHNGTLFCNAVQNIGRGPEPYMAMLDGVDEDALLVLGFVVRGGDCLRQVVVRQVAIGGNEVRMVSFAHS